MGLPTFGAAHFEALEAARDLPATASNLTRLGKQFSEELARWAFDQWDLRKRARAKFEKANHMLFDRDGLEMATHPVLAALHAQRFPAGVRIADLTCGIGADLIAFARNGPAIGYELDPVRAEMAQHNLRVHGLEADIRVEDCMAATWDFQYAYADPTRRLDGKRKSDPSSFSPEPRALMTRLRDLKTAAIKLSPMLADDFLASLGGELWFHSHEWECREVLILAGRDLRSEDGSASSRSWAGKTGSGPPLAGDEEMPDVIEEPSEWFFEADPAAIRAHALGDLCRYLDAAPLGDSNGYLSACSFEFENSAAPWVHSYRVLASGHADEKRIRQELRRLNAFPVAVKVRGVIQDPIAWMRRLKLDGEQPAVVALFAVGKSLRFVLLSPRSD